MNTRHNTSSSDLAFTNDPDAIIRATNALRREAQATVACAQAIAIARILAQRLPTLPVSPPPADLPASAPHRRPNPCTRASLVYHTGWLTPAIASASLRPSSFVHGGPTPK
ncbi:hypothetical protein PCANC_24465 [Puccinia coronata f. sp. avenae]|uniref:Uncharacterized protein n=1 Tax=Puccinia coronata f. sp. avenae TaxID=200324 RepID=A0A2N5S997_9BASI|nr:hypothetical protein PCANC_24465 [Puccinia coronata f. sp. avenae]